MKYTTVQWSERLILSEYENTAINDSEYENTTVYSFKFTKAKKLDVF